MELLAVIRALEAMPMEKPLRVFTDSQYVQKGITEWMINWVKRGWMTAARKPVKNSDLWKTLSALANERQVDWQWVRGHNGHPGNERADQLANRGVPSR